jgi:hypothetical protein
MASVPIAFPLAEVIFGETAGLYPEHRKGGSIFNPQSWTPSSVKALHDARREIGAVYKVNSVVGKGHPSADRLSQLAWHYCMLAAQDAVFYTSPYRYFFLRQQGMGRQRPHARSGFGQGLPGKSYGPFINGGGGDVPKGMHTYIDFYAK